MRHKNLLVFLLLLSVSYGFYAYSPSSKPRLSKVRSEKLGDQTVNVKTNTTVNNTRVDPAPSFQLRGGNITVGSEMPTGIEGYYDFKSNGETNHYVQIDPANPNNVHVVDIQAPSTDPTGTTTRLTNYGFSSDGGTTWGTPIQTPSARSGFPVLHLMGNVAVIANHGTNVGGILNTNMYVDLDAGAGAFNEVSTNSPIGIWPQLTVLNNNNIYLIKKPNLSGAGVPPDTLYGTMYNGTSFSTPTPMYIQTNPLVATATSTNMQYNIDNNKQGRITAIINSTNSNDTLNDNIIWERTSTDNGASWGSLNRVFVPFISGGDTIIEIAGSDVIYKPNTDKWFYAIVCDAATTLLDSTRLYVIKSDGSRVEVTNRAAVNATGSATFNKSFSFVWNIEHPSLGWSADGSKLYCAYSVMKPDTGAAGWNTRDIYFQYSTDEGSTWTEPFQVTNTPTIDEGYPSISKWNANNATTCELNLTYMKDPGDGPTSYNPGESGTAPASLNQQIYRKITIDKGVGITNVSGNVPDKFSLQQNYPNPFNPSTVIRFNIAKASNVTLKVYDLTGRVVATLVNNETVSAGTKEISFNASQLAAGVYFYSLNAGDFKETKKMMLIK